MNDFKPIVREESGGREVIRSGVVFTFSKESGIDLYLMLDSQSELVFRFFFEKDDTGKKSVKAENNDTELKITCVNYDNPLGTGLREALPIGNYKDKTLYLIFFVYGDVYKKMEYCFFIDK